MVKARDLIFHCLACNCDLKMGNKTKHLSSLRHDKAEHPEKYVIAEDKRKCAHCKATKGLDEFRNENVACNRCLEVNRGAQSKSPEMKAVYNKEYRLKHKDDEYHCKCCDKSIKAKHKWKHEKTQIHKDKLALANLNE